MKTKTVTVTEVKKTTTFEITRADLIAAFQLPEDATITIDVPRWAGGDDFEIEGENVLTAKVIENARTEEVDPS